MHDNTLVSALRALDHEALLIPTYTPITTDEADVSEKRVFFGGINVFLQQKLALFRHTPWTVDRWLDSPGLLRWVSRFAVKTQAEQLGDLTVSMLKGEHGHQRKEIDKLVHWLSTEVHPEIIVLTNALLAGMVPEMKRSLGVPVVCVLQGDDIFLESLPEPYREQSLDLIRAHCREVNGFVATSRYYADFMAGFFDIPRERIQVVYPGLNLAGHDGRPKSEDRSEFIIGYFARICPEKGLHVLADAFRLLQQKPNARRCRLKVSGWLGGNNRPYFDDIHKKMTDSGLTDRFEHIESPDHASKVRFLQSLDVLAVPTTYREPKGLYVLEAMANGVPVVQPAHGSFPELIEATGGGLLVNPADPEDLAGALWKLSCNPSQRQELGQTGREAVHRYFNAERMARETAEFFNRYAQPSSF
jgi:glycosyltransferase involved in cell wall biosynthesis